ncbi:MAG: methyltransferase domain-containing protein, partial [Pseudanabaena sp.]
MKLLNLGCGHRFHSAWTNIDFRSNNENVIAHNLLKGIPFPDQSFDVIYHSHVLEHFSRS